MEVCACVHALRSGNSWAMLKLMQTNIVSFTLAVNCLGLPKAGQGTPVRGRADILTVDVPMEGFFGLLMVNLVTTKTECSN